jgi:CspA family cold shock protein
MLRGMSTVGTVRVWHREKGWGVIDSPDTPGGCWAHFSHLWNDKIPETGAGEVVEVSGGFREAFEGETVDFEWEPANQDGYAFRAISVRPHGRPAPHRTIRRYRRDD